MWKTRVCPRFGFAMQSKTTGTQKRVAQGGEDTAIQMGEVLQMTKQVQGRAENEHRRSKSTARNRRCFIFCKH